MCSAWRWTYTAAWRFTAASGLQVQAVFQQPWVIGIFAALFIVMAASMFGLFTLQMRRGIQTRLAALSNRQRAGSYGGVAVMGALGTDRHGLRGTSHGRRAGGHQPER
jgi:thiol:disulfide interchange protein DsbD